LNNSITNQQLAANAATYNNLSTALQAMNDLVTQKYDITFQTATTGNTLTLGDTGTDFTINRTAANTSTSYNTII